MFGTCIEDCTLFSLFHGLYPPKDSNIVKTRKLEVIDRNETPSIHCGQKGEEIVDLS